MNPSLKKCFICMSLNMLFTFSSWANDNDAYFKVLEDIIKIPTDATAIQPSTRESIKNLILMLKNNKDADLKSIILDESGNPTSSVWGSLDIYEGDFSNEHKKQYALITTEGTMRTNTVVILEERHGQIQKKNLDDSIIRDLVPGSDLSNFYYHVSRPFAYVKDGKTYIRFMDYPYKEYDPSQLRVCTYLWENNIIKLAGPNWTYDSKQKKIIPAVDCIGAKQHSASRPAQI